LLIAHDVLIIIEDLDTQTFTLHQCAEVLFSRNSPTSRIIEFLQKLRYGMISTCRSLRTLTLIAIFLSERALGFSGALHSSSTSMQSRLTQTALRMSSTAATTAIPSWSDLQSQSEATPVGKALVSEFENRKNGKGSAHVQNKLRQFKSDEQPAITLFRDHAGWCPYCQKAVSAGEK
jgi:hypothetical protein